MPINTKCQICGKLVFKIGLMVEPHKCIEEQMNPNNKYDEVKNDGRNR